MNIAYELSKIKSSFRKVKEDMVYISSKISDQYDEFLKSHRELSNRIESLSVELKSHLSQLKHEHHSYDDSALHTLKLELGDLKKEMKDLEKSHTTLSYKIEDFKNSTGRKDTKEIHDMKEKIHSSELDIYLLKERMMEKDLEVKQLKDVNTHLFEIVDELARLEQEIVTR